MANFNFYQSFDMNNYQFWYGSIVKQSSSVFHLKNDTSGQEGIYYGSFVYGPSLYGTLTGYDSINKNGAEWSVSGANLSAYTTYNYVQKRDVSGLFEYILSGSDYLYGSNDRDVLYGQDGNDYLNGNQGDDVLYGGSGDDFIEGGEGSDFLWGGSGADIIYGGNGADILAGFGNDTLVGGAGADVFGFCGAGNYLIRDFTSEDKLVFVVAGTGIDSVFSLVSNVSQVDVTSEQSLIKINGFGSIALVGFNVANLSQDQLVFI